MPEDLIRTKLARYIEEVAADTGSGKVPATCCGHQLVALIRHWGYRGHDWETPDAFDEFDLVMMDLELFPDGRRTSSDDILAAARAVELAAKTVQAALPLSHAWESEHSAAPIASMRPPVKPDLHATAWSARLLPLSRPVAISAVLALRC
jgi:hypothetical protein